MNRLTTACAAALLTATLAHPAPAAAAFDSATRAVPIDPVTQIEMRVNANCVLATNRCDFDTQTSLLTPNGPVGLPRDSWARQTITLRSTDRDVWQEVQYSAPAGMPRETKGANHDNVLSRMFNAINDIEISVTYFGGGPLERFRVDGTSMPTDWVSGRPAIDADFIACSTIHVVYGGKNLNTPPVCAQTTFS